MAGWAWFIPLALLNVVLTAFGVALGAAWIAWVLPAILVVGGLVAAWLLPGHVHVPRLDERAAGAGGEGVDR